MSTPQDFTPDPAARSRANKAAALYGLYRLLLFIALTVAIQLVAVLIDAPVPLIMSALLALILAFPLSMMLFSKQRLAANAALAEWKRQRDARKNWIRGELSER
ncbi:hypothetical protein CAPI_01105 [Corynebacterium capitovis DSM 44611]|uniref:DUF4229 domain-containing protein n=1 Tax=Corynebacterium capitovis TaxID=131081 RepID=UPI00037D7893|nr:DUF4229 domain-containing protein [Corynebacterium capitovis]WKD56799.1 hypothetical protein CAPI_01105 [Corynebacterium capitovis DSM 44611]